MKSMCRLNQMPPERQIKKFIRRIVFGKSAFMVRKASVGRRQAAQFLDRRLKPGSKPCTDGAWICRAIQRSWPVEHARDIHKRFEFGKASEVGGMFGILRTFLRRMHRHATPEKLLDYMSGFQARFSSPEMFKNPLCCLYETLSLMPFD